MGKKRYTPSGAWLESLPMLMRSRSSSSLRSLLIKSNDAWETLWIYSWRGEFSSRVFSVAPSKFQLMPVTGECGSCHEAEWSGGEGGTISWWRYCGDFAVADARRAPRASLLTGRWELELPEAPVLDNWSSKSAKALLCWADFSWSFKWCIWRSRLSWQGRQTNSDLPLGFRRSCQS